MNTIAFIIAVIGIHGFITKLSASGATMQLYSARDYSCPEQFLKDQKRSDVLQAVNCLFMSAYGFFLFIFAIPFLFGAGYLFSASSLLIVAAVNIVHTLVNGLILRNTGLKDRMDDIMKQWKTQKRVTEFNDDEVRLYQMIKLSVDNEKYNIVYLILLIGLYFMVTL